MFDSILIDEFYKKTKENSLSILDVREMDEFDSGHIPTSFNIPLSVLETEFEKLEKSKEYYVICHLGGRSSRACQFLTREGYEVVNVLGGMSAWTGELV